ncbi:MAG: Type cbb3 cytochrome oxidase biosis protein CcoG, involved in Cu oxidation [Myxococcaceae bacterium]|nr:Type cbb3 cytochrome oxidase biosis protein CcoG, involved in Cu oxidation [Myxococcaceae bacterium]
MAHQLPVLNSTPGSSALRPDGGRSFIVTADVIGRYARRRQLVFAVLLVLYVLLPWVQLGGHPAVFLDLEHRAFHLFGATFNAQDFWLTFFVLSGIGFVLIVVTALWGRVWCGYACPQTVFLEGVYRRIERLVEGPRNLRLKRDAGSLSFGRAGRKLVKHALFIALSFVVAHVFLSYFVSLPEMFQMMRERPRQHSEAFAWAATMTLITYGNFAWFREQTCLVLCPYGRLQSVLTDSDSLVVGYDQERGEPRGKPQERGAGDCVDCGRCVVVCPTGIDIRNGLQIECIGCSACADACDAVMSKLERPTGLIRYDSQNGLARLAKRFWRPRVYVYAALGLLGLAVATALIATRTAFEANLLRLSSAPFLIEADGKRVRNSLELHVVNKHGDSRTFRIDGAPGAGLEYVIGMPVVRLGSLQELRIPIFVQAPNDHHRRTVRLRIDDGQSPRFVETSFIAP